MNVQTLISRIESRHAQLGIMGMGYVGLPLTLAAAGKGFRVLGFDINAERVRELNNGVSPLRHILGAELEKIGSAGLFEATADFARLREVDAIVICVPTPLTKHREPDLSFVERTAATIGQ